MSHQNSGPRDYVHKDFHNSVIKKLNEKHRKELELIAGMCGNPSAVEGCRLISKKVNILLHEMNMDSLRRVEVIQEETRATLKKL